MLKTTTIIIAFASVLSPSAFAAEKACEKVRTEQIDKLIAEAKPEKRIRGRESLKDGELTREVKATSEIKVPAAEYRKHLDQRNCPKTD